MNNLDVRAVIPADPLGSQRRSVFKLLGAGGYPGKALICEWVDSPPREEKYGLTEEATQGANESGAKGKGQAP